LTFKSQIELKSWTNFVEYNLPKENSLKQELFKSNVENFRKGWKNLKKKKSSIYVLKSKRIDTTILLKLLETDF